MQQSDINVVRSIVLYAIGIDNASELMVEKVIYELKKKYYQKATECINANGKLEVYMAFKKTHRLEPY